MPLTTLKGPAIFLAQYIRPTPPYNTLSSIARWAASLGYVGIQVPISLIDVSRAAEDQAYCDELLGECREAGVEITELSSHTTGQLVAVNPAYDMVFDGFAPENVRGDPSARQAWAHKTMLEVAKASKRLGLKAHATFSGSFAWPFFYPWPQRPPGLIDTAFAELARRWKPILDAFDEAGVDVCYEIHPGEDLHDGVSYERFLKAVDGHPRACILYDPSHFVLQQLNYLEFIDIYHERIKIFHVKDAEFLPTGRSGVYGGYSDWADRPGRFRALGDGQVDFGGIFTRLAKWGYAGWAVLETECAFKDAEECAKEGAPFIEKHIIKVTDVAFDDFAGSGVEGEGELKKVLGIA